MREELLPGFTLLDKRDLRMLSSPITLYQFTRAYRESRWFQDIIAYKNGRWDPERYLYDICYSSNVPAFFYGTDIHIAYRGFESREEIGVLGMDIRRELIRKRTILKFLIQNDNADLEQLICDLTT